MTIITNINTGMQIIKSRIKFNVEIAKFLRKIIRVRANRNATIKTNGIARKKFM
ncbi:MAG: hypothetical protein AABX38_01715 [Candidatus Micrarchaeota archaeon]